MFCFNLMRFSQWSEWEASYCFHKWAYTSPTLHTPTATAAGKRQFIQSFCCWDSSQIKRGLQHEHTMKFTHLYHLVYLKWCGPHPPLSLSLRSAYPDILFPKQFEKFFERGSRWVECGCEGREDLVKGRHLIRRSCFITLNHFQVCRKLIQTETNRSSWCAVIWWIHCEKGFWAWENLHICECVGAVRMRGRDLHIKIYCGIEKETLSLLGVVSNPFFVKAKTRLKLIRLLHADMHHVKSEHEKDDDDDLDDDRKPELGHHGHHSYYQHPMAMGGHYNNSHHHHHHSLKTEIDTISKNQTGSDCGVPIPASKPKIWSLADTAACKTPPPHLHPNAGAWGYQTTQQHPSQQYSNHTDPPTQRMDHHYQSQNHLQQQQHQQQQMQVQQQAHMGMNMQAANGTDTAAGMNMNMITSGHHNQSMSGMMNTFGGSSPYSRYGGFLTTGTHPIQQQAQQQAQPHQYINHNHTGGSTTPVTPNSTGQPTTPTLQQQNTSNLTSNNQTMGFPEVQTGKVWDARWWRLKTNTVLFHPPLQTPRHKLHRIWSSTQPALLRQVKTLKVSR